MKCGTTSLHHALSSHPSVYMPGPEVFFFDIDDLDQNPDFLPVGRAPRAAPPDYYRHLSTYLQWYTALFAPARDDQLVGEDSTTYLASEVAPCRIRELVPDVRLIFMLRDPVARAYSHYWHLVRSGRAAFSFEDTLRLAPENLIRRGCYQAQLSRYLVLFPREQLKVVFFEDFMADPPATINEVTRFLGLDPCGPPSADDVKQNVGGPLVGGGFNRIFNAAIGHRVNRHGHRVPTAHGDQGEGWRATGRLRVSARRLNQALTRRYPPLDPHTRSILEVVYRRLNADLSDVLGMDVASRWPWMTP
jgi:hypothetical protein